MKCNPPFIILDANGRFRPSAEGLHTYPTGLLVIARSVLTPIYRGKELDRSNLGGEMMVGDATPLHHLDCFAAPWASLAMTTLV